MDTKPGEKKKEEGKDWEKLFCGPAIFSVFSIWPYYSRYGHSPTRDAVEGTSPRNFPPTVRARAAGRSASVSLCAKTELRVLSRHVLDSLQY